VFEIEATSLGFDWTKYFQEYLDNITLVYQGHSNDKTQKPVWDIN